MAALMLLRKSRLHSMREKIYMIEPEKASRKDRKNS